MRSFLFICSILISLQTYAQDVTPDNNYEVNLRKYQSYEAAHGRYLQTPHTKMHFLSWGNPKDSALIWIHGSLGSAYEIAPFAADICQLGIYLIAIDYYGHGQTPLPKASVTQASIADDISLLMDSLQIQSAILGGFSRGAYIAGEFYAKYPQRTEALILEDGGIAPFKHQYLQLPDSILRKNIRTEIEDMPQTLLQTYATKEKAYEAVRQFDGEETYESFKNFAVISAADNGGFRIYQGLDSLFGMNTEAQYYAMLKQPEEVNSFAQSMRAYNPEKIFAQITVPILAMEAQSTNDPLPDQAYYKKIKAQSKYIEHKVFQNVSHAIHYEQPDLFLKTIQSFILKNK